MNIVFCKTTAKGVHSFFIKSSNKEYYIFSQAYRKSVKEHFRNGLSIDDCLNYSLAKSIAVRRTLDKLKAYIPYMEKEYGIALYNKTKSKLINKKKSREFNYKYACRQIQKGTCYELDYIKGVYNR